MLNNAGDVMVKINSEHIEKDEDIVFGGQPDAEDAKAADDGATKQPEGDQEESEYELVEEEGESEQEEMVDASGAGVENPADDSSKPQTKEKKKRMVKRKKKKKLADDEEKTEKGGVREKGVQMPEWTQALEIEYMNQDQLKRVIAKLREDGLSEEDIKLGEDLYYKRAAFQIDKFVKMCEVREIVSAALNSILDRMRKADELARKNR